MNRPSRIGLANGPIQHRTANRRAIWGQEGFAVPGIHARDGHEIARLLRVQRLATDQIQGCLFVSVTPARDVRADPRWPPELIGEPARAMRESWLCRAVAFDRHSRIGLWVPRAGTRPASTP